MTYLGHTNIVNCICLSPDNKSIYSGAKDKAIKQFDVDTGECLIT